MRGVSGSVDMVVCHVGMLLCHDHMVVCHNGCVSRSYLCMAPWLCPDHMVVCYDIRALCRSTVLCHDDDLTTSRGDLWCHWKA